MTGLIQDVRYGFGIGIAGALVATRLISSLLYNMSATDPVDVYKRRCSADSRCTRGLQYSGAEGDESRSHGGVTVRVGRKRQRKHMVDVLSRACSRQVVSRTHPIGVVIGGSRIVGWVNSMLT